MKQKKFQVINHSKPRIDGIDKVIGTARYTADIYMDGMLYAGVLRSNYTSAKLLSIDTAEARKIRGVHAVVTCFDLPVAKSWAGYRYLTDVIRYEGDCVAMAAAESRELLDEALDKIKTEYQEMKGVYSVEEALNENSPCVHEELNGNILEKSVYHIRKGNVESGFKESDVILEREYETQFVEHAYIEPEAVVAYCDENSGIITVHASTQDPFFTRRFVSDILELPLNQVRVIQEAVGGTFGGKLECVGLMAARAAYLASITGRPVKYVASREASFLESTKRHPFHLKYKIGAKKDGTILAFEGTQIDNSGAYNNQTQFMNWRANVHSAGAYEIPNVKTDTYGVYTNMPVTGAMRGYSSPSLIFGQEQMIDELAEEIGMDEIELRKKNCLKNGSHTHTGEVLKNVVLEKMIDTAVAQTEYYSKHKRYSEQKSNVKRKGIGIAVSYRGCGLGAESSDAAGCMIIVNSDGSVTINSGLAENGQGLKTVYAQIAAESMGVRYESIKFYKLDTSSIPDCGITAGSRGTVMGAQSVKKAGNAMKRLLLKYAYELEAISLSEVEKAYRLKKNSLKYGYNIKKNDFDLSDSVILLKKYPDVKVPVENVAERCYRTGRQLSIFAWYKPGEFKQDKETGQGTAFPSYTYSVVVAEVEVDLRTGYVSLLNVMSSHDVGTAINPSLVKGQIYGGIVMGEGYGIMEDLSPLNGRVKKKNFDSYIIPTSMDMPEMKINIVESKDMAGTYGAKSLGEAATECVGAAVANAVYNAAHRRVRSNPCDLETVLLGKKLFPVNRGDANVSV